MQVTDAMVAAARKIIWGRDHNHLHGDDLISAALTAALAEMWRHDFDNAPFMEPVLLSIEGRKLPIAVFRHNSESPWRYLESGKEIDGTIVPTCWLNLPSPPKAEG